MKKFDVIIGNPPYGRVRWKKIPESLDCIIVDRYVNQYAAFLKLATDLVRPGGLVGFVIPTSFVGGPYYRELREFLLANTEILHIDLVDKREELFFDAEQDICILILRKKHNDQPWHKRHKGPRVALVRTNGNNGSFEPLGTAVIPHVPCGDEWSVPHGNGATPISPENFVSLGDYGIALEKPLQREFYAEMCRIERWSVRTLRQKIGSMLYERTTLSKRPEELAKAELQALREEDLLAPDLVFRDLETLRCLDVFAATRLVC